MGCFWSCPHQETVGIIEGFGKFSRVAYPGCNCLNPFCGESVAGNLSLRVQQLEVRCETKTRDNVFVTVMVSVQYQVKRVLLYEDGPPPAAFYKLTNSHQQISSYVFDVVRSTVPKMDLDDVFTEKRAIALSIKEELTKSMAMFGYDILQALVNDIAPDAKVKVAMNTINSEQRLRVAAADKAEAAKIKVVKEAEADAEAKYLQGVGVARQRQAIVTGLRTSVRAFQDGVKGVTPQDVLELMLVTQYYDMLREVGAQQKTNTIFTAAGGDGSAMNGLDGLRSSMLEAGACQEMSRA
jgi:regulator of protease activity HflC (stomatin/prohibitin superfamily)